ncbi:MAG TPA: glycoside hydrolase family 3 C-terminal domain-containing protein, partial [Longimicrobiales bacterium]
SETEGWDRTFSLPPGQNELIQRIAARNPKTIVAIEAGGAVDMTSWLDKVPAVIQTWYPGEMGGQALAQLLLGDANPSGHLPATFERRLQDNPTFANYYPAPGSMVVDYKEGIFVGYRGYEKNGTTPLFPFGYGLSYTTFKFSNLTVAPVAGVTVAAPSATPAAAGPRWDVSLDVTNTGNRAGAAVPQVYVAEAQPKVARPAKELKGFAKVMLQPGETRRVTIPLDARSLAYYDVAGKRWKADPGKFQVLVGASSADIQLKGELTLGKTITLQP